MFGPLKWSRDPTADSQTTGWFSAKAPECDVALDSCVRDTWATLVVLRDLYVCILWCSGNRVLLKIQLLYCLLDSWLLGGFVCFLFCSVLRPNSVVLRVTPGSAVRKYSWQCSGSYNGSQESKPTWLYARQILYYHSDSFWLFLNSILWCSGILRTFYLGNVLWRCKGLNLGFLQLKHAFISLGFLSNWETT